MTVPDRQGSASMRAPLPCDHCNCYRKQPKLGWNCWKTMLFVPRLPAAGADQLRYNFWLRRGGRLVEGAWLESRWPKLENRQCFPRDGL